MSDLLSDSDAGRPVDAEDMEDDGLQDIGDEAECLEEEYLRQRERRKAKKPKWTWVRTKSGGVQKRRHNFWLRERDIPSQPTVLGCLEKLHPLNLATPCSRTSDCQKEAVFVICGAF